MSRGLSSIALVAMCFWYAACSCRSCGEPPIATIESKTGRVSASRASAPRAFGAADVGTEFAIDDAVRTARASTAHLRLDDGNALDVRPETTIRFSSTRPGARTRRFDVVEGEAVLHVETETALELGNGVVRASRGTELRLTREGGEMLLVVTMGSAQLEIEGQAPLALEVGAAASAPPAGRPRRVAAAARSSGSNAVPVVNDPGPDAVTAVLVGAHVVELPDANGPTTVAAGTHRFPPGTRIHQTDGASTELARGSDRLVVRGAADFSIGSGRRLVASLAGTPTLESSTDGVAIVTPGGVLVTRPAGGRTVAQLGRDEAHHLSVRVDSGGLDVERDGETTHVGAGETLSLAVPEDGPSCLADHVDLELAAGDGVTIRDPHPPTAIGLATASACPEGAVVELMGSGSRVVASARGVGTIPVAFPEGSPNYRVRCVVGGVVADDVASRGRLRILHTSGQAPLPRNAPESGVDADGRSYQVVYSNRLPAITVRWPQGPDAPGTLVVASPSGTRRVAVSGPRHRFASGAFGEGTHRVHFESGGRRSRDTSITIRFDSAAASASLEAPVDGTFAPGASVRVAGAALNGWEASCGGHVMTVGADQRFSGECSVPSNGVLVVRLSKAGQGTHLYLRRASGG